jgi:hypothetical protein
MGPADVTEGARLEAQGEAEKKGDLEFDGPITPETLHVKSLTSKVVSLDLKRKMLTL